jgi:hypothetical protein
MTKYPSQKEIRSPNDELQIQKAQDTLRSVRAVDAMMAAGQGFEPRQAEPESAVLPLHHPAIELGYPTEEPSLYQP